MLGSYWPFYTLFLNEAAGLDPSTIGYISSIFPWVSLVATPFWSHMADVYKLHKPIYISTLVIAFLLIISQIVFPPILSTLWILICVSLLIGVFIAPLTPLSDYFVLRLLGNNKDDYGKQRLFGAISWGLFAFIAGLISDNYGILGIFIPVTMGFILLMISALWLPNSDDTASIEEINNVGGDQLIESSLTETSEDHNLTQENQIGTSSINNNSYIENSIKDNDHSIKDNEHSNRSRNNLAEEVELTTISDSSADQRVGISLSETDIESSKFRDLFNTQLFLFTFHVFVLGIGSAIIMRFLPLYLSDLGGTDSLVGLTITFTVTMELPFFFWSKRLVQLLGIKGLIILAHLCYIVRVFLYTILSNPWWVLPIELLHGVTFSCFWTASILYASKIAPKGREATVVGIFSAANQGGSGVGVLFGGMIFHKFGAVSLYRGAAVMMTVSLIIFLLTHKPQPDSSPEDSYQLVNEEQDSNRTSEELVPLEEEEIPVEQK